MVRREEGSSAAPGSQGLAVHVGHITRPLTFYVPGAHRVGRKGMRMVWVEISVWCRARGNLSPLLFALLFRPFFLYPAFGHLLQKLASPILTQNGWLIYSLADDFPLGPFPVPNRLMKSFDIVFRPLPQPILKSFIPHL